MKTGGIFKGVLNPFKQAKRVPNLNLQNTKREIGTFGKRFAVKIGEFERSIINTSLTKDEIKSAFKMMDENNGKSFHQKFQLIIDHLPLELNY